MSKVCERFVADWVLESIRDLIDIRQFGSLQNSSTSHALVSLLHHILSETDKPGKAVRVFLLDFAKAFDLIDHTILLQKLTHINVPQMSTNWIRSFLADRKQRVRINECVSDWRTVNDGIPQGTVLGPILLLVMINDLLTHLADRWKFVADCAVAVYHTLAIVTYRIYLTTLTSERSKTK